MELAIGVRQGGGDEELALGHEGFRRGTGDFSEGDEAAQAALEYRCAATIARLNPPRIIVIAGPNGAGKTTFAREFLTHEGDCLAFINADLIAAGLSPFAPQKVAMRAGRLMLLEIDAHVARGESFAIETTLSGLGYARQIPRWREAGYRVELHFLSLRNVEAAVDRVRQRVRHGGHAIPEATVRRRFASGAVLFDGTYKRLVDRWTLYDNMGDRPVPIDWSDDMTQQHRIGEPTVLHGRRRMDPPPAHVREAMQAMVRAAQRAREIARQSGTKLVLWRDGRVAHVDPDDPSLPPLPR
ncbi:zeta toxin family protein [Ramlibacter sp.]|uniref:zeta toxin family protein n=1 Tax=Ramlibacter sp. TaxID=1917967 RepID=UPI003D09C32B